MRAPDSPRTLLVLGLGNVLCSDDGLGVAAIELLRRRYRMPDDVRVLDGGTLGLSLLSHIRASDDLILSDAINAAGPPGTFVRLEGDEVGSAVRTRLSPHQVGVADLLDTLHLLGASPRHLVLLGLVPETFRLGLGLSQPVEAQLMRLVDSIVEEAHCLGYEFLPLAGDQPPPSLNRAVDALGIVNS